MPTYDYFCDGCGHQFELFQPMRSKPVKKCPQCGKAKAHRQIGAGAGILFKGSGFYETDYRSSDYKKRASADTAPPTSDSNSKTASESSTKDNSSKPSTPKTD